jgi:hypothetical protein
LTLSDDDNGDFWMMTEPAAAYSATTDSGFTIRIRATSWTVVRDERLRENVLCSALVA